MEDLGEPEIETRERRGQRSSRRRRKEKEEENELRDRLVVPSDDVLIRKTLRLELFVVLCDSVTLENEKKGEMIRVSCEIERATRRA